ncbi:hypothetical protein GCM10010402_56910 [Actinomadura luteofluorescens]
MEKSPSRARSLVGLVSRPGGTASRRPPALPAMTLLTVSVLRFSPPSGPEGPPSSRNAGDRWHRSGSPGGSLRDQILASLESAFGRDRDHWGRRGVAQGAGVCAEIRSIDGEGVSTQGGPPAPCHAGDPLAAGLNSGPKTAKSPAKVRPTVNLRLGASKTTSAGLDVGAGLGTPKAGAGVRLRTRATASLDRSRQVTRGRRRIVGQDPRQGVRRTWARR